MKTGKEALSIILVLILFLSGTFNSQPCFAGEEIVAFPENPVAWISGGGRITLKEAEGLKDLREKLKELQEELKQLNGKIEDKKEEIREKLRLILDLKNEKRGYEREYDRLWEKLYKETFKAVAPIPVPEKGKFLTFLKDFGGALGAVLGIRSWANITAQMKATEKAIERLRIRIFREEWKLKDLKKELKDLKDQKTELDKKIAEVEKKIRELEELGKTAMATFDGSGSKDMDTKITWQETKEGYKYNFQRFPIAGKVGEWDWDFGDGGSGSGKKVTHTYKEAGNYTVKLTITADHNETATAYTIVTVEEPAK